MGSSRRTTGDINILAMLDGRTPGRRLRVVPAAFRYGAAGVLACSLIAALAWFVRDGGPAPHDPEVVVTRRDANLMARDGMPAPLPRMRTVSAQAAAQAAAEATAANAAPGLPAALPARGAVIVDLPQPALAVPVAQPHVAAGTAPAHAQPPAARQAMTRTAQAAPPARPQPGLRAVRARAQALAHAEPATSHQKRGAAAPRTAAPAAVDTDVAVISAILQHTAARNDAAEAARAAACTDKPCAARMPSRQ